MRQIGYDCVQTIHYSGHLAGRGVGSMIKDQSRGFVTDIAIQFATSAIVECCLRIARCEICVVRPRFEKILETPLSK